MEYNGPLIGRRTRTIWVH